MLLFGLFKRVLSRARHLNLPRILLIKYCRYHPQYHLCSFQKFAVLPSDYYFEAVVTCNSLLNQQSYIAAHLVKNAAIYGDQKAAQTSMKIMGFV